MPNLYPTGYETELITQNEATASSQVIGYKPGLAFSYKAGDFKRDGKNRVLECEGIESWKSWCINCIQTERYMHLAYNSDFGIDTTAAMRATSREEAESILTREITEAIQADPYKRTEYIEEMTFDWEQPDTIIVYLTIHGIEDVTIDITANITKGEV